MKKARGSKILRKKGKGGIPRFIRQESWRYKRVKNTWRRPRGSSSRMRRKARGWPRIVSIGYAGNLVTRGLHPSGLRERRVYTPADLAGLDPAREAARIARTVGEKRRLEIMERAEELNLKVLNPPRIEEVEQASIEEEGQEEGGESEEE